MKRFQLKGSNEQKLKQVEGVIRQLLRRVRQVTTFATPPVPISFHSPKMLIQDSFNYLASLDSEIKYVFFYCAAIEKVREVSFEFKITNSALETINNFVIRPGKMNKVLKELAIREGDRISIKNTYEQDLEDVWIGFAMKLNKKAFNYEQLVIDELDKNTIELSESDERI